MSNAKKKSGATGNTLPTILAGLPDADIEHGEFELCDAGESDGNLRAWLGGLPKDTSRVITFAQDGTGSDGHSRTFFSSDEEDEAELRERAASFAKRTLGIDELREPAVIFAEAEAAYPDLQAWADSHNAHLH